MHSKKVAFQGEHGAYSEIAALKLFPDSELISKKLFQDVFEALNDGTANFAVVPVENSIEGSVNEIYDLLLDTEKNVSGEIFLRINHCLIANYRRSSRITKVYSHSQAIAQCRNYLRSKNLEPIPTYDTAGAVRMIKEKAIRDAAGIASRRAAEIYDMEILEDGIEDKRNNFTRFLALSDNKTKPTGKDRTSFIFRLPHKPGALFSILREFAARQINLTKIESRPTKEKPWEYNFYVDIEGHRDDINIKDGINSILSRSTSLKILGSYKQGTME
ncbi:MAG: prephenate dehydratase [Thermoproteota archaeon]|nr:prephenate dehydratase [Thermoproteota archaeon]